MKLDKRDRELIREWLEVGIDRLDDCLAKYPESKAVHFWSRDREDILDLLGRLKSI